MPRVIRVLHLLKGLGAGGAERLVVDQVASSRDPALAYEIAYLLPWKDALVGEAEAAGVRVHCLGGRRVVDVGWAGRLRRLVRDRHIDVVHMHSPYPAVLARLALRSLRPAPRLVYTLHNSFSSFRLATRLSSRWTMHMDDARFAVSDEARRSLPARLGARFETVHYGVDVEAVRRSTARRETTRRALGVSDGEVLVGSVGNLRRTKDHDTLLHAAKAVLRAEPTARFVVVGDGPRARRVQRLHQQLDLGDRVALLGWRADAVDVIAACDVFVLSSVHEGLPVALLEALTVGVPVVATAVGGIPEVVTDGVEARLVPARAPDALADALVGLVRDPSRRADMAAAARQRGECFDIRRSVVSIEARYQDLVCR